MHCDEALAEEVGALAERRGDYVKFFPKPGEDNHKDRLGTPHLLPFQQTQFRMAVSSKAKFKAHSGSLETHGLLLGLKWVLRTPRHFHRRLPFLIDAKGRTSAPGVRGAIRQIGALLLATNSLLRLVYVPSEHNPADGASRGKRVRRRNKDGHRTKKSRVGSRSFRQYTKLVQTAEHLMDRWGPEF